MVIRFWKGRDSLQQEVWERNKTAILKFLREHPNESFTVPKLSDKLDLSEPTVRTHLSFFKAAKIVIMDERERPAEFRLRQFWPMDDGLIEKIKETLRYASQDTPPDKMKLELSENEPTKIEVTVSYTGREYSRQYTLSLKEAFRLSEASRQL